MSSGDQQEHDPHSSFRLEITLSVGYSRRRALTAGVEGPIVSVLLAVGGVALTLLFVWLIARWLQAI